MKRMFLLGFALLLAGTAGASLAGTDQRARTAPEILQAQHALRAKLDAPNGEYSRFDEAAVRRMESAQDRVFRLLDGVTSLDQLNEQQKVDLFNALEEVAATLLAQDGNRLICHIEPKLGTHLTERRCETVSDREKNVKESRKFMMDHPDRIPQRGN